ncbi:MlaC/ttg2D family ABC transporter substrate-binding protein [Catenovulum sediminis]|uniref:ABC transporter substrate-binding protein n=1 Tax=Catenovulum sediminis TaxID=1740262 RepID=A0ABV1RMQ7_9ALTE|nr:ABC transporter substrate-binding protein [Catenovulum sediminis]
MTTFKNLILPIILLFSAFTSAATNAEQNPNKLLNTVGNNLFSQIGQLNLDVNEKKQQMKKIVSNHLMPHIDVQYVSFKLLGKHVRKINRTQADAFIKAVEHHLTTTYANALMNYNGQKVIFDEGASQVDGKYATVKTRIVDDKAPAIDLQFKLRQDKQGDWKVYDMVAEGISLLGAKQTEIARRISEVGLDKVISELGQ